MGSSIQQDLFSVLPYCIASSNRLGRLSLIGVFVLAIGLLIVSGCATQHSGGPISMGEFYRRGMTGKLGVRFGAVVDVSGIVIKNDMVLVKEYADEPFLIKVTAVNDQRLNPPAVFKAHSMWMTSDIPDLKVGDTFRCTGYESGGYTGIVDGANREMLSGPGFWFETFFHVVKAQKTTALQRKDN